MPGPLQWNAFRRWNIGLQFQDSDIWLLRDHITLVSDVVRDWASGPATDPSLFVPIEYCFDIGFDTIRLYLCANEGNVIEQPNSLSENGTAVCFVSVFIIGLIFRPVFFGSVLYFSWSSIVVQIRSAFCRTASASA
jgi:hypothetical protein